MVSRILGTNAKKASALSDDEQSDAGDFSMPMRGAPILAEGFDDDDDDSVKGEDADMKDGSRTDNHKDLDDDDEDDEDEDEDDDVLVMRFCAG